MVEGVGGIQAGLARHAEEYSTTCVICRVPYTSPIRCFMPPDSSCTNASLNRCR
jgi:hypothetical protein